MCESYSGPAKSGPIKRLTRLNSDPIKRSRQYFRLTRLPPLFQSSPSESDFPIKVFATVLTTSVCRLLGFLVQFLTDCVISLGVKTASVPSPSASSLDRLGGTGGASESGRPCKNFNPLLLTLSDSSLG